ncbi:MAG: OsmC family protein [Chloroflexota bacterium]|nr:OsmC family protein [Chloroflexota bacterium]
MAAIDITWVQSQTYIGTDSTHHSTVISSPDDNVGIKPSELMLMALGSCTAYDVVNILSKKRYQLTKLHVHVSATQDADPPWQFRTIHVHYAISGDGLKDEDVSKAIALSEEKYCSVAATLRHGAALTYDYEIIA